MLILPKIRGFICVNAHPVGCYSSVNEQVEYVVANRPISGAKRVLVIGGSTGYGLASRIVATFGCGAQTIGVSFEREPTETRTASAGWYNNASFEMLAHQHGHYASSINGDAFSAEVKQQAVELIRQDFGGIDLLIYSIAAPRRVHPQTGFAHTSVLKPIGETFNGKSLDITTKTVKNLTLEPATEAEINDTIAVMGGEDWQLWIDLLEQENLLAEGVSTFAYSYLGPKLTHGIYKNGTIGRAKADLLLTAQSLNKKLQRTHNGHAAVVINKAIVTQASAAIPMVPLYLSVLYKVMKSKNIHETCVQQIYRLFKDHFSDLRQAKYDDQGQIRIDDLEMREDVQQEVANVFEQIDANNIEQYADLNGYIDDFYRLFGFRLPMVNYDVEIDPQAIGAQHGALK